MRIAQGAYKVGLAKGQTSAITERCSLAHTAESDCVNAGMAAS